MDLSLETKLDVLRQKLEQYQAQLYSNKLDMACASALEDEKWEERIRNLTKRVMSSIQVLENELDAIQSGEHSEVQ